MSYSLSQVFKAANFDVAAELVTKSFTSAGFGLPPGTTDLSFHKVFAAKKIDDNFKPTHVFGFCNPKEAYQLLTIEPEIAVFLPCSVVLSQEGEGEFKVTTINPLSMLSILDKSDELGPIVENLGKMVNTALSGVVVEEKA